VRRLHRALDVSRPCDVDDERTRVGTEALRSASTAAPSRSAITTRAPSASSR
jgi:hypothetical protein